MALSSSSIEIFDRSAMRRNKERANKYLQQHDFLIDWAGQQTLDRLRDITRTFPTTLQIGLRTRPEFSEELKKITQAEFIIHMDGAHVSCQNHPNALIADEDFFPFAPDSLDLVVGLFNFHAVNDLPGALVQIRKSLKPDGLFIAAMPGGETLHELRHVLNQTELELRGGVSPRVHPFADKQDMGALLQRAGFALPVIDSEHVTVTYDNMFKLMHDLRGMGDGLALTSRNAAPVGKRFFFDAAQRYARDFPEENNRIRATFEIIFLIGWAPHASQQQPLKPGSASHRLADALGTKEEQL